MNAVEDHAKSIFLDALDRASAQWPAFVNESCGDNADLRARVEQLLRAHQAMGSIHGSHDGTADAPQLERLGAVIGPYKLMEQIGEGGMGLVFVAEQQRPIRRKVALKVIKPGMDSRQVIARFGAERQALALMNHPNIAKVFDAGETPNGRPYFVMELVRGVPITEYCDANRLTPRARLELFGQICAAVQHAHQKGIIHRDIKPSNVMVVSHDGAPVVKVIDFGVAKAIGQQLSENSVYTQLSQFVGTPLYMSPEQAGQSGLDIDTRTDVYSLGVLLYELLTGTTPFDKERLKDANQDEIRRLIREEEPPKPSTRMSTLGQAGSTVTAQRQSNPKQLSLLLRGELDWIVMKALEKDRNRRYESASALAADVERYLNDEPVQACPPSRRYLAGKFVRRNRTRLLLTAVPLMAALLVVSGAAWVALDRSSRQTETEVAVSAAWSEADRWEKIGRWPEALAAAKRAVDLLGENNGTDEMREHGRRRRDALTLVLRLGEVHLEFAVTNEKGAAFSYTIGDKLYAAAFREHGFDVETLEPKEVVARLPEGAIRREIAGALDEWASLRRPIRKNAKLTDEPWQRILAVARLADDDAENNRFRDLWSDGGPEARKEAKTLSHERLHPYSIRLVTKWSRSSLGEARDFLRAFQRRCPNDFWVNYDLGWHLAFANFGPGASLQMDEASGYLRAALAVKPDNPNALAYLGRSLTRGSRPEQTLDEAIAVLERTVQIKPNVEMFYRFLGEALVKKGRLNEAAVAFRNAIIADPKLQSDYVSLGDILVGLEDWDAAQAIFEQGIENNPKIDIVGIHSKLAFVLYQKGQFAESTKEYQAALGALPAGDFQRTKLENRIKKNNRYLEMEKDLPLILAGENSPPPDQLVAMAEMCRQPKKQYASAARLYEKAFAANPQLEAVNQNRNRAIFVAALAGCGQGTDKSETNAEQRAHFRAQSQGYLAAEWAHCETLLSGGMRKRAIPVDRLAQWQSDRALAGVRDAEQLAKLPKEEADSWRRLWNDLPKIQEIHMQGFLTLSEKSRTHDVTLEAGKTYIIDLESEAFDAFLVLSNRVGKTLMHNDDMEIEIPLEDQLARADYFGLDGLRKIISPLLNSRIVYSPQASGMYRVTAGSLNNQGEGAYRLNIRSISETRDPGVKRSDSPQSGK